MQQEASLSLPRSYVCTSERAQREEAMSQAWSPRYIPAWEEQRGLSDGLTVPVCQAQQDGVLVLFFMSSA